MKRILESCCRVTAALLLVGTVGCGTETKVETNTVTEIKFLECSQDVPQGKCETGYTCFGGVCTTTSSLCSPTNLEGKCAAGMTCWAGGCVLATAVCSPQAPWGACSEGKSCFGGECVATSTLCSVNNLTGKCAEGTTCFLGGCVAEASLCSLSNPTGPCETGKTCLKGVCTTTADLCSANNTTGVCAPGEECQDGVCAPPAIDACTLHVYTEQPTIVVRTEITARATGKVTVAGVVAGNTFTVGTVSTATPTSGVAFTAVASNPTDVQFAVGADDATTAANLAAAINANAVSKALVTATVAANVINFAAVANGAAGNGIGLSGTSGKFTLPAASLKGGAGTGKTVITVDGKQFKDINGNGTLEPFEDWRLNELCRAKDLVTRMTVPQKVGLMSEGGTLGNGTTDETITGSARTNIVVNNVRQALMRMGSVSAQQIAVYINLIEELAEAQPIGIPVVFTEDPVHYLRMSTNATTGVQTVASTGSNVFSSWPNALGLGAINDTKISKNFGDTVRKELMATGFRWQLGPQADIATEPRWERVQHTMGEEANSVAKHIRAVVEGFQGSTTGNLRNGVAVTIKHFPGAGADEDGMDSHTYPGRYAVYPGNNFDYHLIPFQAAFDTGVAALMPCYSIFKYQYQWDPIQVPSGFSYGLITKLAKQKMGFTGMVTGDWGTASISTNGGTYGAMLALSNAERGAQWLKAGSNQFGSDSASYFQQAFDQGLITEADINGAAAKILEMTFKLGVFENPYVDSAATPTIVKSEQTMTDGFNAQKRAIVLLKNQGSILPIAGSRSQPDANADGTIKVYFDGVTDALNGSDAMSPFLGDYDYRAAGDATATPVVRPIESVNDMASADLAVIRISARRGTYSGLDAGVPLSFDGAFPGTGNDGNIGAAIKDRNKVIDAFRVREGYTKADGTVVAATNPKLKIVLVLYFDRPAIVKPFVNGLKTLDEIAGQPGSYPMVSDENNVNQTAVTTSTATAKAGVEGMVVDFGAFDRAVLDFLFNKNVPPGVEGYGRARLPMEIPSTDAEVAAQYEDVPADTKTPTYRLGAGSNL